MTHEESKQHDPDRNDVLKVAFNALVEEYGVDGDLHVCPDCAVTGLVSLAWSIYESAQESNSQPTNLSEFLGLTGLALEGHQRRRLAAVAQLTSEGQG